MTVGLNEGAPAVVDGVNGDGESPQVGSALEQVVLSVAGAQGKKLGNTARIENGISARYESSPAPHGGDRGAALLHATRVFLRQGGIEFKPPYSVARNGKNIQVTGHVVPDHRDAVQTAWADSLDGIAELTTRL